MRNKWWQACKELLGRPGRKHYCPRSKHKHISNPHCRIAGCGKYLLSRKPPCSEGIVKNYCIEEERKWQFNCYSYSEIVKCEV